MHTSRPHAPPAECGNKRDRVRFHPHRTWLSCARAQPPRQFRAGDFFPSGGRMVTTGHGLVPHYGWLPARDRLMQHRRIDCQTLPDPHGVQVTTAIMTGHRRRHGRPERVYRMHGPALDLRTPGTSRARPKGLAWRPPAHSVRQTGPSVRSVIASSIGSVCSKMRRAAARRMRSRSGTAPVQRADCRAA